MSEQLALDDEIRKLATGLRLGTRIVSIYKDLPFKDRGVFVRDLLKSVADQRKMERIGRMKSQANLVKTKTLDVFETGCLELPEKLELSWLTDCRFVEAKQNLVLLGLPGTGKTHFATALGNKACDLGYRASFKRMSAFVEELTFAHEAGKFAKFKKDLEQIDLLIIDEWGYLPTNVTGTRLLFDVISDCYERRSVILTTNMPLPEWNKIFGDERMLRAMIDRLVHHCYLIRHTGESYRMAHSLMS